MPVVVLIGTLDTKGPEYEWLRDRLDGLGMQVLLVDTGVLDPPWPPPDISREEVARAAGTDLAELRAQGDRGVAVTAMARGAAQVVAELYREGRVHGVLSVGGSGNSTISTCAMRALPVGVPKLMVSSMASGDVSPYIGNTDLTMMYSVVDIAGINRISIRVLANAADAIAGMATGFAAGCPAPPGDRPVIGASMAGVTTPGVNAARELLSVLGYEVLVFHTTGSGGRSLEAMTAGGTLTGVLDPTLLELSTALVGGVGGASPDRLETAGRLGIPQVVSLGCLDMAKFGPEVPRHFRHRQVHVHNPSVSVIRTNADECAELGGTVAAKLRLATGPTALFIPLQGLSTLSAPGGPYHDPEVDAVLFDSVREGLAGSPVEIVEMDTHLNDPAFGRAMADHLHVSMTPTPALRAAAS
ncbi:Tm-1-like ATP-binding domain-containing protein [Spirillospora sp. NPDC047279]|uniref:Tm-1-like ATP-binding domain-containing protein n=1 Tax=Spirillospora sp. NPDC047279 TaxID=3155478 RepID=UPI0033D66C72